ncbi:hypothetical protein Malapachy_2886 [Malassezia pachydermatis]|uniref:Cytoplasmic protein n=1 Tax=Malassezia pachydermatis TaxID=77020 RepID=A0A0M8MRS1_9BASI|nr:hypothetical protein Malapachy_2886 [Malassezia pachydermatis]KOS12470.1 hypothetical protein Malapachy_2886 [Malassezia pachydermatis]
MSADAPRGDGYINHPYAPQTDFLDNTVTNLARPVTNAIITVRIIKNFEYRTMKALVLKDVDLTQLTAATLIDRCKQEVAKQPAFKAYRNVINSLGRLPLGLITDTLKLYTQAHGAKTTNLIINLDHPEWILDSNAPTPLSDLGVQNETELSLFHREAYDAFLAHPETRWDETG